MTASRGARLAQPIYERSNTASWQQNRLELLQPQLRQRQAQRRKEAFSYVMLAVLLFSAACAYMYFEARISMAGREVNDLQNQIAETQNNSLRAELQIGNLSSLSRIESYAKMRLGMVYPDVKSVQYLNQQVSGQLASDLARLTATDESVAEAEAEPSLEKPLLFAAWADLIGRYFSGTAFAAESLNN